MVKRHDAIQNKLHEIDGYVVDKIQSDALQQKYISLKEKHC